MLDRGQTSIWGRGACNGYCTRSVRGGGTHASPVYFRRESGPFLSLAVGSPASAGDVLIAEVNLKFVWEVVSRVWIGENGLAYVVDSRGQLVSHPDLGCSWPQLRTLEAQYPARADRPPRRGRPIPPRQDHAPGRELQRQAEEWRAAQHIKNPACMTGILAPGSLDAT